MTNTELDAINRLNKDQADRFWNAISSIREPACCSFVNENRFRLTDYALRYYVKLNTNFILFFYLRFFRVQRQVILKILNYLN
jgi:hypothetical protein